MRAPSPRCERHALTRARCPTTCPYTWDDDHDRPFDEPRRAVSRRPSANRKPAGKAEAPQEPFKRAVAACMRAMARTPELEVDLCGRTGRRHRPRRAPRRACPSRRASCRRATPRSCAATPTRWRCGSPATTQTCIAASLPQTPGARARCSTRSSRRASRRSASRRMEGVAANLSAMLDDRYHRAAITPRSPTAPTRRSRTPSR